MRGCWDTEILGYMDTDTVIQILRYRYRDTGIQGYNDTLVAGT